MKRQIIRYSNIIRIIFEYRIICLFTVLNLVSVLQLLCGKVKQDKVDTVYLYTDTCRLDTTDDSRLKSTSKDYKESKEKEERGKEAILKP